MSSKPHRSGFAALVGRPNVGKSTLLNRLAGEKLAIVSPKAQTTRGRILGVVTRDEGQVAFLDTPGIHDAKGELNKYMLEQAFHTLAEAELAVLLVDASAATANPKLEVDPKNREILERLQRDLKPTVLALSKIDKVEKPLLLPLIQLYAEAFPFAEIVPISGMKGENTDLLFERVLAQLPEGPPVYDAEMLTDQTERTLVAEYIREQVLRHTRQEIPYSTAVSVDVFDEEEREPRVAKPAKKSAKGKAAAPPPPSTATRKGLSGLVRIAATVYLERDSQKAIVIGKQGQMLKTIGTDARASIERLLGTHVYLSLRVKVEPRWSERPEGLRKLGYE